MQVKKFEAPTIQEALDHVKRELGPEAIILQTKSNKRGFGLMSRASVEITAAISERSLQKKQHVETRVPAPQQEQMKNLPAKRQAEIYDKYMDRHYEQQAKTTQERVELRSSSSPTKTTARQAFAHSPAGPTMSALEQNTKRLTSTRYIDILDSGDEPELQSRDTRPANYAPPRPADNRHLDSKPVQPTPAPVGYAPTTVEDEIRNLRKILEDMQVAKDLADAQKKSEAAEEAPAGRQSDPSLRYSNHSLVLDNPIIEDAYENLVVNGVDRRYALNLIKKVKFEFGPVVKEQKSETAEHVLDLLAKEIMESVRVAPLFADSDAGNMLKTGSGGSPQIITLIGPTGVGKTTTIAKLANIAIKKKGFKVGFINFDHQKPTSFDQLGTYAKILGVPFRFAASQEDFKSALHDFQRMDLIFVDTAGRSQRDPDAKKEIEDLIRIVPNIQPYLVLSATTRDNEVYDMLNRFSHFKPKGLIISKLDEATVFGSVYNLSQRSKIPLVSFTIGQKIPDDLEDATPERVAALVMNL